MPAPLSNDLRQRIILSQQRGDTEDKIAKDKDVHKSTVTKLWSLFRETGNYLPRPNPSGRKSKLSSGQLEDIRQRIKVQPDISLAELKDDLELPVCISA